MPHEIIIFPKSAGGAAGNSRNARRDITIDLSQLIHQQDAATVAQVLRGLLQNGYQTAMRPSPLVARLRQMKRELDRGEDSFERKLRYLLWLN